MSPAWTIRSRCTFWPFWRICTDPEASPSLVTTPVALSTSTPAMLPFPWSSKRELWTWRIAAAESFSSVAAAGREASGSSLSLPEEHAVRASATATATSAVAVVARNSHPPGFSTTARTPLVSGRASTAVAVRRPPVLAAAADLAFCSACSRSCPRNTSTPASIAIHSSRAPPATSRTRRAAPDGVTAVTPAASSRRRTRNVPFAPAMARNPRFRPPRAASVSSRICTGPGDTPRAIPSPKPVAACDSAATLTPRLLLHQVLVDEQQSHGRREVLHVLRPGRRGLALHVGHELLAAVPRQFRHPVVGHLLVPPRPRHQVHHVPPQVRVPVPSQRRMLLHPIPPELLGRHPVLLPQPDVNPVHAATSVSWGVRPNGSRTTTKRASVVIARAPIAIGTRGRIGPTGGEPEMTSGRPRPRSRTAGLGGWGNPRRRCAWRGVVASRAQRAARLRARHLREADEALLPRSSCGDRARCARHCAARLPDSPLAGQARRSASGPVRTHDRATSLARAGSCFAQARWLRQRSRLGGSTSPACQRAKQNRRSDSRFR